MKNKRILVTGEYTEPAREVLSLNENMIAERTYDEVGNILEKIDSGEYDGIYLHSLQFACGDQRYESDRKVSRGKYKVYRYASSGLEVIKRAKEKGLAVVLGNFVNFGDPCLDMAKELGAELINDMSFDELRHGFDSQFKEQDEE